MNQSGLSWVVLLASAGVNLHIWSWAGYWLTKTGLGQEDWADCSVPCGSVPGWPRCVLKTAFYASLRGISPTDISLDKASYMTS